jgi:hypothetical protein
VAIDPNAMDGPIPGENFTSDTKNYPWHRPPEYTNLDDAIEASFKKLTDDDAAFGLLTVIEMGATIADMTQAFVMSGVGAGKWTPDFAILLAGPVSHIMYLMAKGYGIDCDLGIEEKSKAPTTAFFKAVKIDKKKVEEVTEDMDVEQFTGNAPRGGFMGMTEREDTDTVTEGDTAMYDQPKMGEGV